MYRFRSGRSALRWFSLAGIFCCLGAADAAVVEGLYTATVERRNDASDPRAAALTDAMSTVLVRVTGERAAAFAPELARLHDDPSRYVASFGYPSATEALVSFLPTEIDRELSAAGWPVWGAERPLSEIWVVITDQFGQQALLEAGAPRAEAAYSDHMLELLASIREEIETVAEARGLPFVLPELATQEEVTRALALARGYSLSALATMSSSARADAIVVARVRESVIGTDVEWLLQSDSLRTSYPGAGIADGVEWLADSFAEQYRSVGERALSLRISGVRDFDDYARILAYLESVSVLSEVDVDAFDDDVLLLRAVSRGDAAVLARTLSLDNVLRTPDRFGSSGSSQSNGANVLDLVVVSEQREIPGPNRLR